MLNSRLRRNILYNLSGQGWSGLMSVLFIPAYIHFLGIEAYGLIGFSITITAMIGMLDLGLSSTLNRELASRLAQGGKPEELRDVVSSLSRIYAVIGMVVGTLLFGGAPWLARTWIQGSGLPTDEIINAFRIMAIGLIVAWPGGLFAGGLMGIQQQGIYNAILVLSSTLRGPGVLLALWLIAPRLEVYLLWQCTVNAMQTMAISICLYRKLPASSRPGRFQMQTIKECWRFAAGLGMTSVLGVLLTQIDKLVLSRLLSLEYFGYYMLASTVAQSLYRIITPIGQAIFPRFTELASASRHADLKRIYLLGTQFIGLLLMPILSVVVFFGEDALAFWTRNADMAFNTKNLVKILVGANVLNGLISIAVALQWAYGWTRLHLVITSLSLIGMIPALWLATGRFGATGGALCWLTLNIIFITTIPFLMHRRILPGMAWSWLIRGVLIPVLSTMLIGYAGRKTMSWGLPWYIAGSGAGILGATAIAGQIILSGLWSPPKKDD